MGWDASGQLAIPGFPGMETGAVESSLWEIHGNNNLVAGNFPVDKAAPGVRQRLLCLGVVWTGTQGGAVANAAFLQIESPAGTVIWQAAAGLTAVGQDAFNLVVNSFQARGASNALMRFAINAPLVNTLWAVSAWGVVIPG